MSVTDDHGDPIAYTALQPGTTIVASDDVELGTVERVVENKKENIFDGIVMRTDDGFLWVDAPEVARITERRVVLTLDAAAAAAELTNYAPGAPEYRAKVRGGRLSRFFGGGWKRR
jgi:hypothetical protein